MERSTSARNCCDAARNVVFRPVSSGRVRALARNCWVISIQARRVARAFVLNPELKAARGADPQDCRRRYRNEETRFDRRASAATSLSTASAFSFRARLLRRIALLEVFERHEESRHVWLVLGVDEAVAVDDRPVLHCRVLREKLVYRGLMSRDVRFRLAESGMMSCPIT